MSSDQRPPSPDQSPEILTVEQVAELFGVTLSAARRAAALGRLPARKLFGRWYFSRKGISAYLGRIDESFEDDQPCDRVPAGHVLPARTPAVAPAALAIPKRTRRRRRQ